MPRTPPSTEAGVSRPSSSAPAASSKPTPRRNGARPTSSIGPFVESLPDLPNVIFMAGMKFGTQGNEARAWTMKVYLPTLVCEKFHRGRIVAFSTGNVYGLAPADSAGSVETDSLRPCGEYALSCLGWWIGRRRSYHAIRDPRPGRRPAATGAATGGGRDGPGRCPSHGTRCADRWICGRTAQATSKARLIRELGNHAGLVSLRRDARRGRRHFRRGTSRPVAQRVTRRTPSNRMPLGSPSQIRRAFLIGAPAGRSPAALLTWESCCCLERVRVLPIWQIQVRN